MSEPDKSKLIGKISFARFVLDLRLAFSNANADRDPWIAVARRALQLAPLVLAEEPG